MSKGKPPAIVGGSQGYEEKGKRGPWMGLPVKNAKGSKNSKFKAVPLKVVWKDSLSWWEDRKYYMSSFLAQLRIVKYLDRGHMDCHCTLVPEHRKG